MRYAVLASLVAVVFASFPTHANECVTTRSDLVKLINDVSIATGRKFVLDPRVQAQVTLSGFEATTVDYPTLRSVLAVHGFTALETADATYVVPEVIAANMRAKLGIGP